MANICFSFRNSDFLNPYRKLYQIIFMSEFFCQMQGQKSLEKSLSVIFICWFSTRIQYNVIYDDTDDDGIKSNCSEAVKVLLHKSI